MAKRDRTNIKIGKELKKDIEKNLPGMSWPSRLRVIYDFSMIKYKDPMGKFLFGTNAWNKQFYNKKKKKKKR